jgi:hypothetical protein
MLRLKIDGLAAQMMRITVRREAKELRNPDGTPENRSLV